MKVPGPKLSPEERRRRQEAARQPDKDRTAHEAARGVKTGKKMTLAHLTKDRLSAEEFEAALKLMHKESGRGAAIMGAALIEDALVFALEVVLKNTADKDALYFDQGAPFGTLRSKTVAAVAMGVCSKDLADDIDVVRTVRNQFSHSLRPLDFDHPEIAAFCERLAHLAKEGSNIERSGLPDPKWSRYLWESATTEIWLRIHKHSKEILTNELRPPRNVLSGIFGSIAASSKGGDDDIVSDVPPK